MKYKALLLDIDGVMLNKEDDTDQNTWEAINDLIARGIQVSFVTSRPHGLTSHLVKRLSGNGIHIFENGNFIYEPKTRKIHKSEYLPQDLSKIIIEITKTYLRTIKIGYSTGDKFLVNDNYFDNLKSYMPINNYKKIDEELDDNYVSIWLKDLPIDLSKKVIEIIKNSARVNTYHQDKLLDSVFIHPESSSKLDGAKVLSKLTGISLGASVFIGNDMDDICLARKVGLSASPANALDDLKKISGIVSSYEYSRSVSDIIQKVWGIEKRPTFSRHTHKYTF